MDYIDKIKSRVRTTFLFTMFSYLLITNILRGKNLRYLNNASIVCFGLLVNIIMCPVIVISLILTLFYKKFAEILLRLRKGNKFKGFISGIDCAVHEYPKLKRNVCIIYLFESGETEENFLESLRVHIQTKIFLKELPDKMYWQRRKFMGYYYYEIAEAVDINEIIQKGTVGIPSRDLFLDEISRCIEKEMPLGNSFNWDLQCGSFIDKTAKKHFLLIRMQHTVCDIIAMYNIFTNLLCKENESKDVYAKMFLNDNSKFSSKNINISYFSDFLSPKKDYLYDNYRPHGGSFSYIEDIDGKYFGKVKEIKKNMDDSTITLIIMTCYLNSLKQVLIRKNLAMKDFKTLVLSPYQKSQRRIYKYYKNEVIKDVGNDFFIMGFHLKEELLESVENTLINLRKSMEESFQSADKDLIIIFYNTMLTYFPNFVLKWVVSTSSPVLFGGAPGGPKLTLFNGDNVKNILVTLPKYEEYGCLLYFYSYDGKLSLTINSNENIFSREELDWMLKTTFENIDVLYNAFVLKKRHLIYT